MLLYTALRQQGSAPCQVAELKTSSLRRPPNRPPDTCNPAETTVKQVEDTFKDFTQRDNIAIVLINQFVSLGCWSSANLVHQLWHHLGVARRLYAKPLSSATYDWL